MTGRARRPTRPRCAALQPAVAGARRWVLESPDARPARACPAAAPAWVARAATSRTWKGTSRARQATPRRAPPTPRTSSSAVLASAAEANARRTSSCSARETQPRSACDSGCGSAPGDVRASRARSRAPSPAADTRQRQADVRARATVPRDRYPRRPNDDRTWEGRRWQAWPPGIPARGDRGRTAAARRRRRARAPR